MNLPFSQRPQIPICSHVKTSQTLKQPAQQRDGWMEWGLMPHSTAKVISWQLGWMDGMGFNATFHTQNSDLGAELATLLATVDPG